MKQNFITTLDSDTATLLRKSGYTEIPSGSKGLFTFINDKKLKFDNSIDASKIKFTNMLYV